MAVGVELIRAFQSRLDALKFRLQVIQKRLVEFLRYTTYCKSIRVTKFHLSPADSQ